MRKLWAASAAMLVCLALGGGPALAQEASEAQEGIAWVTGTSTCTLMDEGVTTTETGVERMHAQVRECIFRASDTRVDGQITFRGDFDCYEVAAYAGGSTCRLWGIIEGDWSGWGSGILDPSSGEFYNHFVMTGTGAREGLVFVGADTQDGFSGLLYEGEPPPIEVSPSASSE